MKLFKSILIICLVNTALFGYVDEDIDGVDDGIDLCLDTPFDEVVDDFGCSYSQKNKNIKDRLTIEIGSQITFNDISENNTNISIYGDYRFKNWDVSLSTSSYTNIDLSTSKSGEFGDLYLSGGYVFKNNISNTKLSIGTKLSTGSDIGTGENDYYASIFYDYFLNNKQDIFLYYSYTISTDSDEVDYENYSSFSIGSGYALNKKWYSSLSYDFSQSNYAGEDDYQAISWFNTYSFTKKYYLTFNYTAAIDELSYDHSISLLFGINFE